MRQSFRSEIIYKTPVEQISFTASAEARICLECPIKVCNNPDTCIRYKEEKRKLKELKGNDKRSKKKN